MFSGGWKSSASWKGHCSASASKVPTVLLPLPLTPITTTTPAGGPAIAPRSLLTPTANVTLNPSPVRSGPLVSHPPCEDRRAKAERKGRTRRVASGQRRVVPGVGRLPGLRSTRSSPPPVDATIIRRMVCSCARCVGVWSAARRDPRAHQVAQSLVTIPEVPRVYLNTG